MRSMKNKVLIVATSSKTRGGISAVVNQYRQHALWEDNHCVWIENHIDKGLGLKVWFFIKGWFSFLFKLPSSRLVHIHFSSPLREFFFLLPAKVCGKKVIAHLHTCSEEVMCSGINRPLYRLFFSLSDLVIVLSSHWAQKVRSLVGDNKRVEVLFNPCGIVDCFSDEMKEKCILFAGTLIPRKGYETLIRAFSAALKRCPGWRLELAGNGEIKKAEQIAKELGSNESIRCLGWISGEEKQAAFSRASIFCLPSYEEGLPMAILDAFSYGLPVITTPVGGIPDIAIDGQNMLLFPPGDEKQLEERIVLLATDAKLRMGLSEQSRKLAADVFSLDAISKKLQELYDSLLK